MFAPAHFGVRELAPAFPAAANRNQREEHQLCHTLKVSSSARRSQMEQWRKQEQAPALQKKASRQTGTLKVDSSGF